MKHYLKAGIASGIVLTGFVARELTTSGWRFAIYAAAVAVVFAQNAWDLKPDKRLDKIRKIDFDARIFALFSAARAALKDGQRLPFRVNVMIRTWRWRAVLRMVYSYEVRRTDPDYGLPWPQGHGLCWQVYGTGKRGFVLLTDKAKGYALSASERSATKHIKAVLSLPIRSGHGKDGEPLSSQVRAVLNVDALTTEAAQQLQEFWEAMEGHQMHPLIEFAEYAGLYF